MLAAASLTACFQAGLTRKVLSALSAPSVASASVSAAEAEETEETEETEEAKETEELRSGVWSTESDAIFIF
jgi:hypothetical protein